MSEQLSPPAPHHLRAASAHPEGRLPEGVRRPTLQAYLDQGLVYRNDADGYVLPASTAQDDEGGGPYLITGAGRRAVLNDSQRAIGAGGVDGAVHPTDGDDGRSGPKYRPYLTHAGIDARAVPPKP
ncbi:hypothetical protein [Streptomyces graminilatus]|uniref:hypothetical protein n=1 Tax=Streptomyces graminilatus TaxID=1464070 RepID=UPI0006E3068E|nr:hypothetical protein [Streptomyces graminilatus]